MNKTVKIDNTDIHYFACRFYRIQTHYLITLQVTSK